MTISLKAGIIGGAGYTGGELIRLLINHPHAEIAFVHSRSHAGSPVHSVHTDLLGATDLCFTDDHRAPVDVLFLCLAHGASKKWLQENEVVASTKIIDLSQDFRWNAFEDKALNGFVYGLPELLREQIKTATHVANPGCFATALQLSLLPLAANGIEGNIHVTGITGSTGAGVSLTASSHFSWRANNVQAYKTLDHQHLGEVRATLGALQPSLPELFFVPWRGSFTRGIYLTAYAPSVLDPGAVRMMYKEFYKDHPFTHVSDTMIDLKQVVNTNNCVVYIEQQARQIVIHAAIDNLLKGASGQAVQNMNLMFGLPERAGLQLKSTAF